MHLCSWGAFASLININICFVHGTKTFKHKKNSYNGRKCQKKKKESFLFMGVFLTQKIKMMCFEFLRRYISQLCVKNELFFIILKNFLKHSKNLKLCRQVFIPNPT